MKINGVEGLSTSDVQNMVRQGGRFVIFSYCVSILIMTFKRPTDIYFIKPGEGTFGKHAGWTVLSLFFGWWGIPWGFIYTPWAIIENLSGGKNVTNEVMASFIDASSEPQVALPQRQNDGPKVEVR
jgi:hypothetical protein